MWYPAKTTTEPTTAPVTASEVKSRLYIDFDDDNGDIDILIAAATDYVERYCNIRLMAQTVEAKCDGFDDFSFLPFGPVQSVSAIKYIDIDGAEQTLDTAIYEVRNDDLEASIVLQYDKVWPARRVNSRITVTAVVGYAVLPPAIKQSVLLIIATGFKDREAQEALTFSTADALLSNFRHGA